MAAEADLAALADEELAGIGKAQMMRIEAVARLDALIEPFFGIAPLIGYHAAFAGTGSRARHGGAAGKSNLRLIGQSAEAHSRDIDRDIENHGALGARADDGARVAFLPVALDDEASKRAGQKGQIVPVGDPLEQGKSPHAVTAKLRFDVDVVHHLGREDARAAEQVF